MSDREQAQEFVIYGITIGKKIITVGSAPTVENLYPSVVSRGCQMMRIIGLVTMTGRIDESAD